ncbi:unnamed protein product [Cuscuta europaea]|uniref:Transposase-associated domain-containing protein n=1 Tax=Cuscuta europaea TaxID=41803 RepID=A0A9P0ZZN6_CUSEU|nr:unnamed protein product [Cuscuta europaea]
MNGVECFVEFARLQHEFSGGEEIRCPCRKCGNRRFHAIEEVKLHLFRHGFIAGYETWTSHGELLQGSTFLNSQTPNEHTTENVHGAYSGSQDETPWGQRMLEDIFGGHVTINSTNYDPNCGEQRGDESPNEDDISYLADHFQNVLQVADQPLYEGCNEGSQLQFVSEVMSIKSDFNVPQDEVNRWLELFGRYLPRDNTVPRNYYETKKLVAELGLPVVKIDACPNGCMLFWKNDKKLEVCTFCGEKRYTYDAYQDCQSKRQKRTAISVLRYLPLTPRLQRLYASRQTAESMIWHSTHESIGNLMGHPSDSEAWKHIDNLYPDFASDPRNVRLALCSDGFATHGQYGASYSCWPVILTTYNLPPGMCMKSPYTFLSLIIPGPMCPKRKIDIYLQPLIDELKHLWDEGSRTYDVAKNEMFSMRAVLMLTISDFPAYGMLSGWSTAGILGWSTADFPFKAVQLGRTPLATELLKDGFQKKGTNEWSGPRAQEIAEKVAAEVDRKKQDSEEGTKVDENAVFLKVVSPKKGKIFGVDPFTAMAMCNGSLDTTSSRQTQYVKLDDFNAFKSSIMDQIGQMMVRREMDSTHGSNNLSNPNMTQGLMSQLHTSMFPTVPSGMTHNLHAQQAPYYPTMYPNGYMSGQQSVPLHPSMPSQVPFEFIPLQNRNSTTLDDTFLSTIFAANERGNEGGQ